MCAISDNLSWQEQLKTNFQIQIVGHSSSLFYISEQRTGGSLLIIKISNKVLLKWRELKDKISNVWYLEQLSLSSVHLPFSIKPGTGMIEESLRSLASKVHAQSKSLRGQARINFLNKTRSFHVYINWTSKRKQPKRTTGKIRRGQKSTQNAISSARQQVWGTPAGTFERKA